LTTSDRQVVAALEQAIARRIGEPRYQLWFASHTRFTWDDQRLTVGVANLFQQNYLESKFGPDVAAAAAEAFGQDVPVDFVIDPGLFQAARREQEKVRTAADPKTAARDPGTRDTGPKRTRRWHRLSDFVIGPCNRVAHAAALSVVEEPGQGPNPLVLHGPVGTGKTHLLEGIYAGLRKGHPEWEVRFVSAEEFTNSFLHAMHAGKLGSFRRRFRECDALLVDDLHFLATKRATQEEFLHTFNALQAQNRQLVVTCDCHPRLADDFAAELADRLLGGAVWGLTPPDAETRRAILGSRALRLGEPLMPEAVLDHLAEKLRGNVRELEGALHALRHFSRVTGRSIDLVLANEALADLLRHSVRVLGLADIDSALCRVLKLETGALQAKERSWAASHPRMLAMYLARKHTSASYSEIGLYFGGRNHSTAVAAEKKVRVWLRDDGVLCLGERSPRVREIVELVERELLR
jgi:chromosomal replication initiator protein